MNHNVKRRRQALHQTHHHYYLNISVEAANLSDWRIESKKNDSVARIESNRNFASASEVTTLWRYTNLFIIIIILLFFARIGMLYRTELPILKSVYNFSSSDALNTV